MIIGACGFGSTGSSAVSDYLKEYSNVISAFDSVEMNIAFMPDGLIDLENHLMHPHSRTSDSVYAMIRFKAAMKNRENYYCKNLGISKKEFDSLIDDYLDSITQVRWRMYENVLNSNIKKYIGGRVLDRMLISRLRRKYNVRIEGYPYTNIRFAVRPADFYEKSIEFLEKFMRLGGADFDKNIVIDQPFSGNDPASAFPFFRDPIAIVVDRDPRDNYVFAKTKLKGHIEGFMPVDNVEDFIKYYRALRDDQPYKEKNARVLRMQFESMVYDYDNSTKILRDFLSLPENPAPRSIFDPALSIANTQTFKRFPEYKEDVKIIEESLSEYLFDFSKYPEIKNNGEMFFGKSPKNVTRKQ